MQKVAITAPIDEEQIRRVNAFKFLYITWRGAELSNALMQPKVQNYYGKRMREELEELKTHTQDYATTRRMLENDRIIQYNLIKYSDPRILRFQKELFEEAYMHIRQSNGYNIAIQYGFTDRDIQEMIAIFIRYRVMDNYMREEAKRFWHPISVWLRNERKNYGFTSELDS